MGRKGKDPDDRQGASSLSGGRRSSREGGRRGDTEETL